MVISFSLNAQTTIDVPHSPGAGVLQDFILGDTLADGSRVDLHRIYRLERGKVYFLSGTLGFPFDLNLISADEPADSHPPVIAPSTVPSPAHSITPDGNVNCNGIYFINNAPDKTVSAATMYAAGEDKTYIFENCIFEGNAWNAIGFGAGAKAIIFRDNIVRNAINSGSYWNGRGLSTRDKPVETCIIENNTFFNLNAFAFRGEWNEIKNFKFNHNTIVNMVKWPIQWHFQTNAEFNNNIFYNTNSNGETAYEANGQDVDHGVFGIFNMYKLDQHVFIDSLGYTEAGRKVELKNNDWFFSSEVTDYWSSLDSIMVEPWMNPRTQGFFDDDANYPSLIEENTMNMDPAFINAGTVGSWSTVDSMLLFIKGFRDPSVVKPFNWGYEAITSGTYEITWPLPENLAYTNSTLLIAAAGDCPIGDLNWFPAKKAQCTPVANTEPSISKGLSVEQNMPNPFKGQTTIAYTLADAAKVNVTIIDINGKVITTLVNENQPQGRHTTEWNATNQATGIYFYQIKTDNALITRKLELIK